MPPVSGTTAGTVSATIRAGGIAAATSLVGNLLVLPLVLDRLGTALYGAWIALTALVAVGALADAGISAEVARRVAAARGADDEAALRRAVHVGTTAMVLTVVPVVLLAVLVAPFLTDVVFPHGVPGHSAAQVQAVVRVMLLTLAVNLVLNAHLSALRGVQRGDIPAFAQVASLVVYILVLVVGLSAGWRLWSLVAAQVGLVAVSSALQWRGVRRVLGGLGFRVARAPWPVLASYLSLSVLALVSQVGDVLDSQWDKLVISRYVGSSAVTSFHVGTMIVLQAKVLALLPLAPLLAGISELRVSRTTEARALQRRLTKAAGVTSAVALGGVFTFTPSFLRLWLGPGYDEAGTVARIFVIAVALNVMSAPLAIQAFAEGRHRVAAWSAVVNMAVNAVASLVLTIHVGIYGAVVGSVIGNLSGAAVIVVLSRRRLAHWARPAWAAPAIAMVAVALAVATGFDRPASWLTLLASSVAFAVAVAAAGTRAERLTFGELADALGRR